MNYKETLFFVAKCLTITKEPNNRTLIEKQIKSGDIDWDDVVRLSTSHYVFPALYCNLKRGNLLYLLPADLVEYMEHITNLNRERNEQIIAQAKEINELLLSNNITPIFLKGTGNLLEGLYEDIAERMVGDIDFLVSKTEYELAISILQTNFYTPVTKLKFNFPSFKHYPRIQREDRIAAVEVHKEMTLEKYADEFNYQTIANTIQKLNNVKVLSFKHQLCLSIIAKQINDNGYLFKDLSLRNAYDVYLLSFKTVAKNCFDSFNLLKAPLNNFLASCYITFGKIESLQFNKNKASLEYTNQFTYLLNHPKKKQRYFSKQKRVIYFKTRLTIILQAFTNKEIRFWLIKRLTDKKLKNQIKKLKSTP